MESKEISQVRVSLVQDDTKEPAPHQLPASTLERLWFWEFAGWLLGLTALAAVVALLSVHKGKPAPTSLSAFLERHNHPFTINSLISICSTAFRLGLAMPVAAAFGQLKWTWFRRDRPLSDYTVIDKARRGVLGSAMLLFKFRGKHLVSLGALISIATLIADFSFQSLVSYPIHPQVMSTSVATTFRAQGYHKHDQGALGSATIDPDMQKAMYVGLFSSDRLESDGLLSISPICPTGNCTWDLYTSLGVCSKCLDVSSRLDKTCGDFSDPDDVSNTTQRYCNYTLPNGPSISGIGLNFQSVSINITKPTEDSFGDLSWTVSRFQVVQGQWNDSSFPAKLVSATATDCALFYCVKKFRTSVENGKVTDVESPEPFVNNTEVLDSGMGFNLNPPQSFTNSSAAALQNFNVDSFASNALTEALDNFWNGTATANTYAGFSNPMGVLLRDLDFRGLASLVQNLATSITTAMRVTSVEYQVQDEADYNVTGIRNVLGNESKDLPIVTVEWTWLLVPATMLASAMVFLVGTIVISNQNGGAALWKGVSLAPLYQPLTADAREALMQAKTIDEIDGVAEKMNVRWINTDKGWRLAKDRSS